MKSINLAALLILVAHSALAHEHEPIGAMAKTLDDHLEIIIHHPSADPNHYINHVTVWRGTRIVLDQDFNAQTDAHSLDLQIPHPSKSPRKRIKKRARIKVYATCNEGQEFNKDVIVH
jgi:desulfoferrodoxin (superoxide reductase-like protein)